MRKTSISRGSGNIYKDLGFANATEMQVKATLVSHIMYIVEERKWTNEKVAIHLGIPQSKLSAICRGQFFEISLGKLMHYLNKLKQNLG